jgi:transposase
LVVVVPVVVGEVPGLCVGDFGDGGSGGLNRPEFRAYFLSWEGWQVSMPVRYDQDIKAKAIRLVREHAGDYPSEYAAITAVARRLGMTPETLRKWIRQAAVDEGQAPGVSSEAAKEIRELKRKVSELERTIEILTAAASFFAREHDPLHR